MFYNFQAVFTRLQNIPEQYPFCISGKRACIPEEIENLAVYYGLLTTFKCAIFDSESREEIAKFHSYIDYEWNPNVFCKSIINQLLSTQEFRNLPKNNEAFPDRSSAYFSEEYWLDKKTQRDQEVVADLKALLLKYGVKVESDEPYVVMEAFAQYIKTKNENKDSSF